MKTIYLNKTEVPANLRNLLGYTGNKFKFRVAESVNPSGMQWSGGSRSSYLVINLENNQVSSITDNRPFPHNQGPVPSIDLVPGSAVVEHSIFCGKDMGLTFYIHPDNAPLLLPKQDDDISRNEKIVLAYTRALKSSYGGIKNYRFHSAKIQTSISLDDWEAAKTSLIEKKLLRKNGAITPNGRNIDTSEFRPY